MRISKRNRVTLRTAYVTFFMILCGATAVILMGHIFNVVERNGFGNNMSAFKIVGDKGFIVFGKYIHLPVIAVFENISEFFKEYAPGIIKLLGFGVNGAEELIENGVYKIVSSLK